MELLRLYHFASNEVHFRTLTHLADVSDRLASQQPAMISRLAG
jgi:hypothetical protein